MFDINAFIAVVALGGIAMRYIVPWVFGELDKAAKPAPRRRVIVYENGGDRYLICSSKIRPDR